MINCYPSCNRIIKFISTYYILSNLVSIYNCIYCQCASKDLSYAQHENQCEARVSSELATLDDRRRNKFLSCIDDGQEAESKGKFFVSELLNSSQSNIHNILHWIKLK